MRYIDLPKPHGYLIWKGKQKAVVSPTQLPTDEKLLVIQGSKEAFGEVVLSAPAQISLTEFERLEIEHNTREEERKLTWPEQKAFFFYRFKEFNPYLDSKDVEIENGYAELLPEIELSADEKDLLEKAERLPKTLILKDDAVVLEDGKAIFCEGLNGEEIMPILSTYFDNKEVTETLPLYQLALVRIPKLKLKKNMEDGMGNEDVILTKAEGTKPYKVVMNHSGCTEAGKPVGVVNKQTGKLEGCSENADMANQHMAAMMANELPKKKKCWGDDCDCECGDNDDEEEEEDDDEDEVPSGVTSFADLEAYQTAQDMEDEAEELVEQFGQLAANIMGSDLITDKPAALVNLGNELITALSQAGQKSVDEAKAYGRNAESLEGQAEQIRGAFYDAFNPKPAGQPAYKPTPWVKEVYDDHVCIGYDGKLYSAGYTTDENGDVKFADKSKWAEMQVQLVPTGNVGAKAIMEGYNEGAKSFNEWITDYYELLDNPLLVGEDAQKAVWTTAFVNNLPDSSFLYIVPGCGDKDDQGKTKPRSCRMFPVKDSTGKVDLPHLRNAIARAPQASTIPEGDRNKVQKKAQDMLAATKKEFEDEKAGKKVQKGMLDKLKKAHDIIKEFMGWAEPDEEDMLEGMASLLSGKSAIGIKKVGDEWWYVTYSTNAFKDREKEIFSTKSLEKYVSEAEQKKDRGFFNIWHIQNKEHPDLTDFAKKEWQGVAGRFLVEAGPFLNNAKGKAALKFFKQYSEGHPQLAPEGWGCSPEYKYLPEERKKGIYENIWITRTSTLPKMAAANIWTNGGITMALSAEQKKSLEAIFGEDEAKNIISVAETKTKDLEEAGIAHKEVSEEVKTEGEKEVEVPEGFAELVAKQLSSQFEIQWKSIGEAMSGLAENNKTLKTELDALKTELTKGNSEAAKKAKAEQPKFVFSLHERASEAQKTIVPDEDPLKDKKPVEASKSTDGSGASHFFGSK